MFRIAYKLILFSKLKFLAALIGIIFTVVLINIQGGLFFGLLDKSAVLVDYSKIDIWIMRQGSDNTDYAYSIPAKWLSLVEEINNVELASLYLIGHNSFTVPGGDLEEVLIIGFDRTTLLGSPFNTSTDIEKLFAPDTIFIDKNEQYKLKSKIGDIVEIGGHKTKIVGYTDGIVSFTSNPYVFTSYDNAVRYANINEDLTSYIVIKVSDKRKTAETIQLIQKRLPYATVLSTDEFTARSKEFWVRRTSIGAAFGASTLIGIIAGAAVVFQTMYLVSISYIKEYGILKATGAKNRHIYQLIIYQALLVSMIGVMIGLLIVLMMQLTLSNPNLTILIDWKLSTLSVINSIVVSILSSIFPYYKIKNLSPAEILR